MRKLCFKLLVCACLLSGWPFEMLTSIWEINKSWHDNNTNNSKEASIRRWLNWKLWLLLPLKVGLQTPAKYVTAVRAKLWKLWHAQVIAIAWMTTTTTTMMTKQNKCWNSFLGRQTNVTASSSETFARSELEVNRSPCLFVYTLDGADIPCCEGRKLATRQYLVRAGCE